ncbi:MAG: phosphotransferase [Patescibacteria group bacterium]
MNRIYKLFNEQFVMNLFREEVLPHYPDFVGIKKIIIREHKKLIWEKTYHVVLEFKTYFVSRNNKIKILPIFCTAHSEEPREKVFQALKHLWDNGFAQGWLTIPHPLFYSDYFKATFYRGVKGYNLFHYIREKNYTEIENIIPQAAAWFAKLHKLPAKEEYNFNKENSRIKIVIPGLVKILKVVKEKYPVHYDFYKKAYKIFIKEEEGFIKTQKNLWLVHGDAHPENVIKMGKNKLAVIDYTDICVSDFARDLGTFLQQLEFMTSRKINDPIYSQKIKKIFLDSYLLSAKIRLNEDLTRRINNYYNWTAIRTVTFFLLRYEASPERAEPLIKQIKKSLNL